MNEDLIFQEYSTNRGLQATYPNYESYRDFVMSQQPQQANSNNVGIAPLNSIKSCKYCAKPLTFVLIKEVVYMGNSGIITR